MFQLPTIPRSLFQLFVVTVVKLLLDGRLRQEIENKIDATADIRFCEMMVLCSYSKSRKGFLSPRELI